MTPIPREFEGQHVLVTGVTGGIGRATAELLIERGARVILGGRDRDKLEVAGAELGAASIAEFDLASSASIDRAMTELFASCGHLDALINVAGIFPARMVADLDDAYIHQMLSINLVGAMRLSQFVSSKMFARGAGSIVHVSSLAGEKPVPGLSVYAASKAGLEAFSKALAHEVAPKVRVNIVAPGPTRTETTLALLAADHTGAATEASRDIPLGRLGEPEEIAEAAAFMASTRASFITGAVLHVNGGSLMS